MSKGSSSVTPKSCPVHNVALSEEEINQIVHGVLDDVVSVSSKVFPLGSSYNNRLYAVTVTYSSTATNTGLRLKSNKNLNDNSSCKSSNSKNRGITRENLVLKVNGWPTDWKHVKVQNEVVALSLVKRHCPAVPVPEVIAYCDGIVVASRGRSSGGAMAIKRDAGTTQDILVDKEWILMSRLPGERIAGAELTVKEKELMQRQVAEAFAAVRLGMPDGSLIGNFLCDYGYDGNDFNHNYNGYISGKEIVVMEPRGLSGGMTLGRLLNYPNAEGAPWTSLLDYYRDILKHEVNLAERYSKVMSPNMSLIHQVNSFLAKKLPVLPIFHDAKVPLTAFTHGDLSDRNLLFTRQDSPIAIQDPNSVKLSGWVDWEFAGYYNPFEEFLMVEDEEFIGKSLINQKQQESLARRAEGAEAASSNHPLHVNRSMEYFYKLLSGYGIDNPCKEKFDIATLNSRSNSGSNSGSKSSISTHWETAKMLYQMQCNIIPWFVRVKSDAGELDGLEGDVKNAGASLREALEWFESKFD